jgi:hypothetical protein
VTRLSAADIALGKFAAAWGTSLVFLSLTLPLVVYAIAEKGVPVGRVVVVTAVLALLLGTVCAMSLALSAVLSRTTTSGVMAYLAVFALTIGTLISFGLATAITTEKYTQTYDNPCPTLPPDGPASERDAILANCGQQQSYQASRARTDRTWWLLAPNPFVILADAAPQLPELTDEEKRQREEDASRGVHRQDARDLDPLGGLGRAIRDVRRGPAPDSNVGGSQVSGGSESRPLAEQPVPDERKPVWPWGLAFDVVLAVLALWLTTRRLTTPTRNLPKGQRVA